MKAKSAMRLLSAICGATLLSAASFCFAQPAGEDARLHDQEAQIAAKYERLEMLASRLSELSRSTQPRRAQLLRDLVARSKERDIQKRFAAIVASLEENRLAEALESQTALQGDLQEFLELLLQEDRDRQIESQRERINNYLKQVKKLIRQQRGIQARTEGDDDTQALTEDQQQVADSTETLQGEIEAAENERKADAAEKNDSPESEDPQAGENQEGENQSGESQSGENQSEPSEGEGSKSPGAEQETPAESSPSQDSPSESNGSPSQGESSDSSQSSESSQQQQSPAERATERLRQAQQRMQQAKERLEQAKKNEAVEEQEQAVRELEQAKAELERILRQLREEEMERVLMLLEARFRRMLEAQNEVYDETLKLHVAQSEDAVLPHELEIASGRLSRKEAEIVREADRALILLREDGTSVAFPEAIEQAREDMQNVVERLSEVKLGTITQGLEEDIIAALEETLAALEQQLQKLREQQGQPQDSGGEPGEQSLVDQLAELRMILALQERINRRTVRYDEMIEGEHAMEADLLEALDRLSVRQERVWQATIDLDTKRNR